MSKIARGLWFAGHPMSLIIWKLRRYDSAHDDVGYSPDWSKDSASVRTVYRRSVVAAFSFVLP